MNTANKTFIDEDKINDLISPKSQPKGKINEILDKALNAQGLSL